MVSVKIYMYFFTSIQFNVKKYFLDKKSNKTAPENGPQQPNTPGMMQIALPPGCLPGLQYLLNTSSVWVQQIPNLMESK